MKKTIFAFFAGTLAIAGTGCIKNDGDGIDLPVSSFAVVHASADAPNLDVFANTGLVVQNFAYGADTGYYATQSGTYNFQVAVTATATALVSQDITMAPDKAYSVFIIDSFSKIKLTAVEDNFTAPPGDSVRIRFLHFSPDAPAVDIVSGGTTVLAGNRSFNDQAANAELTQFITVAAGTYNLDVRLAGTSTILLPLSNTVLAGGKVYTFYAKGFAAGTGTQALGVGTIVHNE